VRKSLARNIGYPLQDFIRRTSIIKTLDFLRESQYWDENRLEEYRLTKLQELIEFSSRNVPYYERLFNGLKLRTSDFKSISDLVKIPILTKEIARKENYNLVARNFRPEKVKRGKTGGTTGTPLFLLKDTRNRSITWASYYRWYEWMGIEYGDRTATLWGTSSVLSHSVKTNVVKSLTRFLHNHLEINSFQMSENDIGKIYKDLVKFQPVILKGYLSALLKLAEYIETNKLDCLNPGLISTTSENLFPNHRQYLKKVYDSEVFDQYGCGELSAIAYECSFHSGLHINQEHIILEILDQEGKPVSGKTGRVLGTDLDNYVMPFIRYENGDEATLINGMCGCGINQPLMTSIVGRTADTIILKNGSSVHGVFLTDIFYELGIFANRIGRFQAIQSNPGEILLLLESKTSLDKSLLSTLEKNLETFFSTIEIRIVKEIPYEKTGKFQYIKRLA
jgi:phenylacetate-CoA ligase